MSKKYYCLTTTVLSMFVFFNGIFSFLNAANLINGDSSFETGRGPFENKGSLDEKAAYHGQRSLKLNADESIKIPEVFKLKPGRKYNFSVYMKSDVPKATAVLTVYRSDWKGKNISGTFTLTNEWKRYSLEVPPQSPGDWNNFWLMIHAGNASVNIDACQFEEDNPSAYASSEKLNTDFSVVCPVEGNVFFPGEPVKFAMNIFNNSELAENAALSLRIEDYYGNTVKEENFQAALKANDKFSKTFEMLPNKKGFYFAELKCVSSDGKEKKIPASFCVVNKPPLKKSGRTEIFGASGVKGTNRLDACQRMGVNWISTSMRWTNETKRGVYNEKSLADFEKFFDDAIAHGMNIAVYLRRTPDWASVYPDSSVLQTFPPKDEYIEDYGKYVYNVVSRFKNKVKVWQSWGDEIDGVRNKVTEVLGKDEDWFIEKYAKMMEAGYKAAKKADPDCIWSGCSVSGVECDQTTNFHMSRKIQKTASAFMDEFVIHPYCWPWNFGEGQRVQGPEEHKLLEIYKTAFQISGKPIWNGEYGFAIYRNETLNSKSAKMMADYTARSLLITAASPNVRRIQLNTFCDENTSGLASFDQWYWPNPLPVVAAYSTAAFMLNGADKPAEVDVNGKVKCFSFVKASGALAAIWIPENSSVKMIPAEKTGFTVYDIMGNEIKNEITLSGSPVYIETAWNAAKTAEFLKKSVFDIEPVEMALKLKNEKLISVYLKNLLSHDLKGTLELKVPASGKGLLVIKKALDKLRPGISEEIPVQVPAEIDFEKIKTSPVICEFTAKEGKKVISWKPEIMDCLYCSEKPSIDGKLDEWEKRPCIDMNDSRYLWPLDVIAHSLWTGSGDFSARVWTGWDEKNFYFAARVTDDLHLNTGKDKGIWAGDSVQMAFDTENNAIGGEVQGYDRDEKDFAFGLNSDDNKVYCCQYWPLPPMMSRDVVCAIKRNGSITAYEIMIPFERLSPLMPLPGNAFGYNFVLFDSDTLKEGKSKTEYWMNLTFGIANGRKPELFKTFILKK